MFCCLATVAEETVQLSVSAERDTPLLRENKVPAVPPCACVCVCAHVAAPSLCIHL